MFNFLNVTSMISNKMRISVSVLIVSFVVSFSAYSQQNTTVKVKNFEQLKPLLHQKNDTLYVVNFWATWCAPCIKEVPYFEQIGQKYKDKKVKVLMVSLDFPQQLESRVIPFIEKQNMKNEVVLLDDPRQNKWIPQVDEEWTGALPATLIYTRDHREFHQKEFTFDELEEIIKPLQN